jgi:hypothetical protein
VGSPGPHTADDDRGHETDALVQAPKPSSRSVASRWEMIPMGSAYSSSRSHPHTIVPRSASAGRRGTYRPPV